MRHHVIQYHHSRRLHRRRKRCVDPVKNRSCFIRPALSRGGFMSSRSAPYDIKNALWGSPCGERELCRRSAPPHLSALSNFPLPIPRLSHSPALPFSGLPTICSPSFIFPPLVSSKIWAKIPPFFHDAQKSYRNPGFSSDLPAGLDISLFFPCICPKTAGILGIAEKKSILCPTTGPA